MTAPPEITVRCWRAGWALVYEHPAELIAEFATLGEAVEARREAERLADSVLVRVP